jgi:hypothetical protein
VAAVSNERHRRWLLKSYADHTQMIAEATRPGTCVVPRSRSPPRKATAKTGGRGPLPDLESSPSESSASARQEPAPAKIRTERGAPRVSVMIGFGDQPTVIEETE